ncbi:YhcH/YjgK/YiaL family protein [Caproicibacter sp.]|uniref:YhcH/YjgK/YiaL family protein n=1 Tax=Caproicibacter sp. TaxID=2814884 RepID=UPI003988C65E
MILDTPANLFRRCSSPQWKEAEKFYRSSSALAPGRYELNHGVFALVQEGVTTPEEQGDFEVHRKYTDLQIVTEGSEWLVWSDTAALTQKIPYDSQRDAAFFSGEGTSIPVRAGMCYVMTPSDGHKACCHRNGPLHYRKLVIKIPVDPK